MNYLVKSSPRVGSNLIVNYFMACGLDHFDVDFRRFNLAVEKPTFPNFLMQPERVLDPNTRNTVFRDHTFWVPKDIENFTPVICTRRDKLAQISSMYLGYHSLEFVMYTDKKVEPFGINLEEALEVKDLVLAMDKKYLENLSKLNWGGEPLHFEFEDVIEFGKSYVHSVIQHSDYDDSKWIFEKSINPRRPSDYIINYSDVEETFWNNKVVDTTGIEFAKTQIPVYSRQQLGD